MIASRHSGEPILGQCKLAEVNCNKSEHEHGQHHTSKDSRLESLPERDSLLGVCDHPRPADLRIYIKFEGLRAKVNDNRSLYLKHRGDLSALLHHDQPYDSDESGQAHTIHSAYLLSAEHLEPQ